MSFETITVQRDFSVVSGYVQVPPNQERDKSRVTLEQGINTVPGSVQLQLSLGSGPATGSKFGAQRTLRLPPIPAHGSTYLSYYGYDPAQLLH